MTILTIISFVSALCTGAMSQCKPIQQTHKKAETTTFFNVDIDTPTSIIDNHFYFEKLNQNHSQNTNETCTLVAAEILLSYYDTFHNDNIVPEEYEFKSYGSSYDISNFSTSPGSGKGTNQRYLYDELYDIALTYPAMSTALINGIGLTDIQLRTIIQDYVTEHDIAANVSQSYLLNKLNIKNSIDNNQPIIVSNVDHCMVAYAYNEDYVWVHTGYYYCGVLPWDEFTTLTASWIRFEFNGSHVCSNNYYNSTNNHPICPFHDAGETLIIEPSDFGFGGNYVTPYQQTSFVLDGVNISTQRYRCGYINDEYVNISPKRYNYGQAYLMVMFERPIKGFTFNLSYWQVLDILDPEDSTATLRFMDYDDEWWRDDYINLLSLNLPTDRTHQMTLNYNFASDNVMGFWIKATSPAVGDRNLGRISIGDISVRFCY